MSSDKPLPFIYQFAAGMLLFVIAYSIMYYFINSIIGAVAGVSEVCLRQNSLRAATKYAYAIVDPGYVSQIKRPATC